MHDYERIAIAAAAALRCFYDVPDTKKKAMSILYFLIGCSILMALVFLTAFFWAMNDGQNNDLETPGIRILFEDEKPADPKNSNAKG